jgi:hypothetical protein
MSPMSPEEVKLALDIGYFVLLGYVLRRFFNLADAFANRLETKLDSLIAVLTNSSSSSSNPPTSRKKPTP